MARELPDIVYLRDGNVPIVDSVNSMYQIPMYKNGQYFSNLESNTSFISACERVVRTNDRYSKYINYLKKVIGLNHCQVMPNITDDIAEIEMHHGPIFTLYDYCAIMIEYFIMKNKKISTFRIADAVLREHEENRIQTVMLCCTVHQEVHQREIFLNYQMGFGDLSSFIKKYGAAINDDYIEKLNRYVDTSMMRDSDDYGVLQLSDTIMNL